MKRKTYKLLLCLLIGLLLSAGPARAESTTDVESYCYPEYDDPAGPDWGRPELDLMNGWHLDRLNLQAFYVLEGKAAYCIEPGVSYREGTQRSASGEDFWFKLPDDLNPTIPPEVIRQHIGTVLTYGYQGYLGGSRGILRESEDTMAWFYATQLLIWETVAGYRDENFAYVSAEGCDEVRDCVKPEHPLRELIFSYYDGIVSSVRDQLQVPSFMSKLDGSTVHLKWDGSTYSASLTDSAGVMEKYRVTTEDCPLSISISGSVMTLSSSRPLNREVELKAVKSGVKRSGTVIWGDGIYGQTDVGSQDLVMYAQEVEDPVVARLTAVTDPAASLSVLKKDGSGVPLGGAVFILCTEREIPEAETLIWEGKTYYLLDEQESGEDGRVFFGGLDTGDAGYFLAEKISAEGHSLLAAPLLTGPLPLWTDTLPEGYRGQALETEKGFGLLDLEIEFVNSRRGELPAAGSRTGLTAYAAEAAGLICIAFGCRKTKEDE